MSSPKVFYVPTLLTLTKAIRDSHICRGSLAKRTVLLDLLLYLNFDTWTGAPSYATLAEAAEVNTQTAQRAMAQLVKDGVVAREVRPNRPNIYTLNWKFLLDKAEIEYTIAPDGEFKLVPKRNAPTNASKGRPTPVPVSVPDEDEDAAVFRAVWDEDGI